MVSSSDARGGSVTESDRRKHGRASETIERGALTALLEEIARSPETARGAAWEHALRPGAIVGRFELVREIGRGGFGVVWEAKDVQLGRSVAFKAVRAGGDAGVREERLLREAEAAARLSHPNIVTLHDVGRAEHGPFLVLELLRGTTLDERLAQGGLTVAEAVRVGVEVASGVAHAHEQGVVHRDLKPANVFLCEDGRVKVLDFGMAHAFGRRRADGGTRAYMAPEQREGAPEDERTDVFALGVMLFQMLAGRLPFPADGKRSSSAPPLDVPGAPELGALVEQMLERSAVKRPRDAVEVLARLSDVARHLERARVPALEHARPAPRRGRRIAAVASAAVLLGAGAGALVARRATAPEARPSVAVLPFADLSPLKDQEHLSDGLAEEILSALSRVEGLRVAGRTSSFFFKGRSADLREIGERLRVGSVVEGSVRRSGERIRVTAELVNVADGFRIWSETYDRDLGDIFAVQDEIARSVAAGLRIRLLPGAHPAAGETRTRVPEAYTELLRGRHLARLLTERDGRLAIEAFERSIALDPGYAAAHAALSAALLAFPSLVHSNPDRTTALAEWNEAVARAGASAERAIALAPDLPDGYSARAGVRFLAMRDWTGAKADLERALELDPRDVRTRARHAQLLAALGRVDEAIPIARDALESDPLATFEAWTLGSWYNATGRFAEARAVLSRGLEIAPNNLRLVRELCFTELLEGRPNEALTLAERSPAWWARDTVAALAYADLGRAAEMHEAIARLERQKTRLAYQLAQVHAWRGDLDHAFAWLDRAREHRDEAVVYVKYDPLLRKIRGDPRYARLLGSLNLPVE